VAPLIFVRIEALLRSGYPPSKCARGRFAPFQPPIRDISTREGSKIGRAGKRLADGDLVAAVRSSE
jgi:hypothetical protein